MRALVTPYLGRRDLMTVAGVRIPSYLVMLYLGCTAGLLAGMVAAADAGLGQTRFAVATLLLLIPALIGSRLFYVLQYLKRFRADPRRLWRRGEGGAALYGGLVLSVGLSVPMLTLLDLPFWPFWDAAIITMIVGLIITRIGCLMHGCCAGRETQRPWGIPLPNHRGEWKRRWPTQLLEAGIGVLLLVAAYTTRTMLPFSGARFLGVIGAYAIARVLLEQTREPDPQVRAAGPNTVLWMALFIASTLVVVLRTLQ